jgi:hypothetical protein
MMGKTPISAKQNLTPQSAHPNVTALVKQFAQQKQLASKIWGETFPVEWMSSVAMAVVVAYQSVLAS